MKTKTVQYLDGLVKFTSMWDPIYFGETDITSILFDFLNKANGKEVEVVAGRESLSIKMMESDRVLNLTRTLKNNKTHELGLLHEKKEGFGCTNTLLQLEYFFTAANSRNAILEIEEDSFTVRVNKFDDNVPTVFYSKGNSATLVGNYEPKNVCKPGTNDCCIFLSVDGDGFACEKFNGPAARILLDRFSKGEINATRIGNCKCGGRWEALRNIRKNKETESIH